MKNIGKKLGIFTLVGFAITTGYFACQNQSLKKQKTRLEIQVESYSIRHADLDEKFREKNKQIEIYSDSLQKMQNSNKEVELENKNLGQEKKKFEDKYYALAHQFEEFKRKNLLNTLKGEKYDSLMNEFQIVFADYNKIEETSKDLEEKFNKLLEMYNEAIAEKSKTGDAEKHISSKNQSDDFALELKYNSFFRDWKSISPRFKDLSENSVIAVDNNPEGMLVIKMQAGMFLWENCRNFQNTARLLSRNLKTTRELFNFILQIKTEMCLIKQMFMFPRGKLPKRKNGLAIKL